MVETLHIPVYELEGYEADDVLGALSIQASRQGIDTIIITGDADTMQLVSPLVKVLSPKPRGSFSDTILYDEEAVLERYGIRPDQISDFKALKGDPSDNIPGVPGVGDKTATKLIQDYSSIDQIYEQIDEVTPVRIREILRQNEPLARQSKELTTIVTQLPVSLNMDECGMILHGRDRVTELFRELEFYSLLRKIPFPGTENVGSTQIIAEQPPRTYKIINTTPALDELLNRLSTTQSFAFDLETTSTNAMLAELVGISLAFSPGEACYLPVGHVGLMDMEQLPLEQVIDRLRPPL
ncbi:5'-3' exonuclease H3TH domain-containing protein, partial [Chloroflexota bacterium]